MRRFLIGASCMLFFSMQGVWNRGFAPGSRRSSLRSGRLLCFKLIEFQTVLYVVY